MCRKVYNIPEWVCPVPCSSVNCVLKLFRVCIVFVMYSSISWIWSGTPGTWLWALFGFFWTWFKLPALSCSVLLGVLCCLTCSSSSCTRCRNVVFSLLVLWCCRPVCCAVPWVRLELLFLLEFGLPNKFVLLIFLRVTEA